MSRDDFRNRVFDRDLPAQDAHHIIERRLWDDGGYHIDNGVSVCGSCHIKAEQTLLDCNSLRESAGITKIILPSHLYNDEQYTKWGDIIQQNGTRIPGELFYDESVQKILGEGGVLALYLKAFKYPRTYHLPWSPGTNSDDRILNNVDQFKGKEVVITEKMDGENTSLYRGNVHARSISMDGHLSRDWVKSFHSTVEYEIPEGWRFCGENLYAKHSIHYQNLFSYFYLFNIWNNKNECLSWDETVEWAELLNIHTVPVLYRGMFNENHIRGVIERHQLDFNYSEGYVVRLTSGFSYRDFRKSLAKYVRPDHIRTTHHWKRQPIIKNILVQNS
jgi:hypothetical protein